MKTMAPPGASRGLWAATEGASIIEFAIVASVLATLALGASDFGIGFWQKMEVGNAALAGAEYAVANGWASPPTAIETAVTSATGLASIVATPTPTETCGCPNASTGITTATCGSTCASGDAAGTYVTANAQASYTTLFPWPVISNPVVLTSSVTVRIK